MSNNEEPESYISDEYKEPEIEVPEGYDELQLLKNRADMLGVQYHHKIGVDRLKTKIEDHLQGKNSSSKEAKETKKEDTTEQTKDYKIISHSQFKKEQFSRRKRNAGRLVRINVTCMNPEKTNWEGEIISVGSAKLGTFKKYVPFNTSDGWHVPNIIYEAMKERKCSVFYTVKDHLGQKVRKAKLIKEFNIELLPPLTKEELKELARKQAMSNSIDSI